MLLELMWCEKNIYSKISRENARQNQHKKPPLRRLELFGHIIGV